MSKPKTSPTIQLSCSSDDGISWAYDVKAGKFKASKGAQVIESKNIDTLVDKVFSWDQQQKGLQVEESLAASSFPNKTFSVVGIPFSRVSYQLLPVDLKGIDMTVEVKWSDPLKDYIISDLKLASAPDKRVVGYTELVSIESVKNFSSSWENIVGLQEDLLVIVQAQKELFDLWEQKKEDKSVNFFETDNLQNSFSWHDVSKGGISNIVTSSLWPTIIPTDKDGSVEGWTFTPDGVMEKEGVRLRLVNKISSSSHPCPHNKPRPNILFVVDHRIDGQCHEVFAGDDFTSALFLANATVCCHQEKWKAVPVIAEVFRKTGNSVSDLSKSSFLMKEILGVALVPNSKNLSSRKSSDFKIPLNSFTLSSLPPEDCRYSDVNQRVDDNDKLIAHPIWSIVYNASYYEKNPLNEKIVSAIQELKDLQLLNQKELNQSAHHIAYEQTKATIKILTSKAVPEHSSSNPGKLISDWGVWVSAMKEKVMSAPARQEIKDTVEKILARVTQDLDNQNQPPPKTPSRKNKL